MIGRLQRYAMDHAYATASTLFARRPATGKRIAVIGAGPAGLSCAGELARRGHAVTVFEKRALAGGLSTYGIIALREPVAVALAEVEMIARLGVHIETDIEIGRDVSPGRAAPAIRRRLPGDRPRRDARLGIPGEEHDPRWPAVHRAKQTGSRPA